MAQVTWNVTEQDALDLLTLVSLLHRRLDAAVPTEENHSSLATFDLTRK